MIRNNKSIVAGLVFILVCLGGYTLYTVYKKSVAINESTKSIFADSKDDTVASYTDLNGNVISLEQYLGKILVVTSWASWSPFSKDDLMTISEMASQQDSNNVAFIAINRKESREQAQRYANTLPALGSVVVALDPTDHFYTSIGGYAMPETVIYNQKGDVVNHIRGVIKHDELKSNIDEILK